MLEKVSKILWRKLTRTDFNDMEGRGAVSGSGGGARHIPLGTQSTIDVASFLGVELNSSPVRKTLKIEAAGTIPSSEIEIAANPNRRNGEWRIANQTANRYPLWSPQNGFPDSYDQNSPPIIFLIRTDEGKFHARFTRSDTNTLDQFPEPIKKKWKDSKAGDKGIMEINSNNTELPNKIEIVMNALQKHGSVLLYGPPGTGKTLLMKEVERLIEQDQVVLNFDSNKLKQPFLTGGLGSFPKPVSTAWVTFHQTFSYEDFIIGLRPKSVNNGIELEPRAGILLSKAMEVLEKGGSAFIFIDEINRANVSKVFGEFVTLIERDKRLSKGGKIILGKTAEVNIPILNQGDQTRFQDGTCKQVPLPFSMPYHVYLVATMNSLDRSVLPLDTALARRFYRIEMPVNYEELALHFGLDSIESIQSNPVSPRETAFALLKRVNEILSGTLGDDFQLGQSYVWSVGEKDLDESSQWSELTSSWENGVLPQAIELLRANPDVLDKLLRASTIGQPANYPYSREKNFTSIELEIDPPILRNSLVGLSLDDQKAILRFLAKERIS